MKQYKFSLKDECMKELPALKEPQRSDKKYLGLAGWENYFKEYLKWFYLEANNLQSIPVPKEHLSSFTDGKIYNEDEFEICNYQGETFAVSIIKQKVNDTELWIEVLKIANEWNTGTSIYSYVIKELQKQFTITRK